jgi:hypothetical protein
VLVGTISTRAAIGIALVSGFGGALVTGYFTTRHDRRERFRALRVEAATACIRACAETLLQLSRATKTIDYAVQAIKDGKSTPEEAGDRMKTEHDRLIALLGEARAKRVLVDLLFGVDSPVAVASSDTFQEAFWGVGALAPPGRDTKTADEHHMAASVDMETLSRQATAAILRTGTWTDYLSRTQRFLRLIRVRHPARETAVYEDEPGDDPAPAPGGPAEAEA